MTPKNKQGAKWRNEDVEGRIVPAKSVRPASSKERPRKSVVLLGEDYREDGTRWLADSCARARGSEVHGE